MDIQLHPSISAIVERLRGIGGRVFIVGGAVRDALMNLPVHDIDLEVFNVSGKTLQDILSLYGNVTVAGKFSIFTVSIDGLKYDFSLPRRDNKTGQGYKAFDIDVDPYMTLDEAAARRDYTINAMMIELPDFFLYDFFDGRGDIKRRLLRKVSNHYSEDPMRVIRGIKFASRLGFSFDIDTALAAFSLLSEAPTLNPDLLYKQWREWALGDFPALALLELKAIGWDTAFPAIGDMVGVQQDPEWHPEGDVFSHTLYVVAAMKDIIKRENIIDEDRVVVLMLAALLHDVGKPKTTVQNQYHRWIAPDHASEGVPIAQQFMDQNGIPNRIKSQVLPLIREHMSHIAFFTVPATHRSVKRLAIRLSPATLEDLALVIEADHSGRPPLPKGMPSAAKDILEIGRELDVNLTLPKPILLGRHLIEMGMKPNRKFGIILNEAFEAQLNGHITDIESGKQWVSGRT